VPGSGCRPRRTEAPVGLQVPHEGRLSSILANGWRLTCVIVGLLADLADVFLIDMANSSASPWTVVARVGYDSPPETALSVTALSAAQVPAPRMVQCEQDVAAGSSFGA
jgi:hypothetical protein